MSYDPKVVAGKQPDGTQGIATIEFKNGDTVIKTLVGCIVGIQSMEKSIRNILKVENGNENVNHFVYVPWFQSCRPSQLSESTILLIRLHNYRKPLDPKGFEVSKFDFGKYKDDQYFVIPCKDDNFKNSSFLKKWSSELLLYNSPSQLPANKVFYGFKKETQNSHNILYKFQEFKLSDSGGVDQTVFSELEEQGVLQVHQEKKRYVIGCYKKGADNQIKMFGFLLKGLTEIEFEVSSQEGNGPNSQNSEGERNGHLQHLPLGHEGERNDPHQILPPFGIPPEGEWDNSYQNQLRSGNPGGDRNNTSQDQLPTGNPAEGQESEDGRIGSSEPVSSRQQIGNDAQRGNTVEVTESEKKSLICQTFGPKVLDMHNKHHNVVQYVCMMLNAKQLKGNNFRSVASKIGLDYFESQELARAGNPMEEVFGVMISRAKTVENFVDILYEIDRNDVVEKMYEMSLAVTRST